MKYPKYFINKQYNSLIIIKEGFYMDQLYIGSKLCPTIKFNGDTLEKWLDGMGYTETQAVNEMAVILLL